jgi:hypothetical protein
MDSPQDLVLLGVGSALLLAAVVGMVIYHYWSARAEALREVRHQFAHVPITLMSPNAYFRGFARSWDGQWRGHGVLLLTDEVLYFRPWQGRMDITVPVRRIEEVKANSRHGKTKLRVPRLQVSYVGMDDQLRVATWQVKDPQRWIAALLAVCERKIAS